MAQSGENVDDINRTIIINDQNEDGKGINDQDDTTLIHAQQQQVTLNQSGLTQSNINVSNPTVSKAPQLNQKGDVGVYKTYTWDNCIFGIEQLAPQMKFLNKRPKDKMDIMRLWLNTKYAAFSNQEIIRNAILRLGPRAIHELIGIGLQGHISLSGNNANKQAVRDEYVHPLNPDNRKPDNTVEITIQNLIFRVGDFAFYDSAMSAKKSKIPGALSVSRLMMSFASMTFGITLFLGLWSNGQFDVGLLGTSNTTFIASAHVGPATRLANLLHAIEFNNALKQNLPNQRAVPAFNLLALSWSSLKSSMLPSRESFPASITILFIFELYSTLYFGSYQSKLLNSVQTLVSVPTLGSGYYYDLFKNYDIDNGGLINDDVGVGSMNQVNAGVINQRYNSLKQIIINSIIQSSRNSNQNINDNQSNEENEISIANQVFSANSIIDNLGILIRQFKMDGWFDSRFREQVGASLEVSQAFYNLCSSLQFNTTNYKVIEVDPNAINNIIINQDLSAQNIEQDVDFKQSNE